MEANANTPSLFDVIRPYEVIKVDDYQRTYAWGKDEVQELFDDLKDCVNNDDNHFFGTLIFQTSNNEVATIVDGQQRLTTTFVLVAALRDEIHKLEFDTLPATGGRRFPIRVIDKAWDFLYSDLTEGKHRFESNRFLSSLLKRCVYEAPERQEKVPKHDTPISLAFRKAIREIRELIRTDLEAFPTQEAKLVRINDFLDAIRDRFLVLRVTTTNLNESLEIFLTLNNRGLPLGPSDLVRGKIMSLLSFGESERAQGALHRRIFEEWKEISDNVKDNETFLRHYLVANSATAVQKKKVFKFVEDMLEDSSADVRKAKASGFWHRLLEASEVYGQIISPGMGGESQYYLEILGGLLKSHRIFCLTLLQKELPLSDQEELLRLVYVLSFKWVIAGKNAQILENFFQDQGNALRDAETLDDVTLEFKRKISEIEINSREYFSENADSDFVGKAVLHYLNHKLTPGANHVTLDKNIHLEHIAPQTETDEWKQDLFHGDESKYKDYSDVVTAIGNLTLLDFKLNIRAKQLPLAQKQPKYDKSVMKIARDLRGLPLWDKELIETRTEWAAEAFDNLFVATATAWRLKPFNEWFDEQPS
jgi:hypothetical protein